MRGQSPDTRPDADLPVVALLLWSPGLAPGTASDTFILRSLLPANLLAYALDPNPEAVLRLGPDGRGSGSLIDFQVGDDPKLMGVLWLILALILINGRELEESQSPFPRTPILLAPPPPHLSSADSPTALIRSFPPDILKSHLRRLSLHPQTALPTSHPTFHTPPLTLDPFLTYLRTHKYLETVKPPSSGGATQTADVVQTVWRWGSRSDAEIGEKDLTELIGEMVVGGEEEEGGGDGDGDGEEGGQGREEGVREGKEGRGKREKRKERVRRDVGAAAGSVGRLRER